MSSGQIVSIVAAIVVASAIIFFSINDNNPKVVNIKSNEIGTNPIINIKDIINGIKK